VQLCCPAPFWCAHSNTPAHSHATGAPRRRDRASPRPVSLAKAAREAAEPPNPLAKYGSAATGSAQDLLAHAYADRATPAVAEAAAASAAAADAPPPVPPPTPSSGRPVLGRRQSFGFGWKRSVAEVVAAVAAGEPGLATVDFSSEAVFQMKPDEKMADLCAALVAPGASPVASLKLRDCGLGDGAVQWLASHVLAQSSSCFTQASSLTELDLSMNCALKEDGALALAAALASNDTLQVRATRVLMIG
jgi:hypothetical protein